MPTGLQECRDYVTAARALRQVKSKQICMQHKHSTTYNTIIHPFNSPFSGTTQVRRYEKGKTNLDFTEERDSEWQWHQLGRMQVCTSFQTDNHASTPPLFFTGRMPFLPPNQQCQSTEGNNIQHKIDKKPSQ